MATTDTKSKATSRKTVTSKKTRSAPAKAAAKAPVKMVQKPAAKPSPEPAVTPKLVSVSDPVVTEADLKKKELIDLVVERSGIKKKDAKPVVEAMLSVLGETIAKGRELNLQPLGKLRINRSSDKGNGRVIVCKLRQSLPAKDKGAEAVNETLAEVLDKL